MLLAIHENLALPFRTQILGLTVNVIAVEVNEAGELIAFCEHDGKRQPFLSSTSPLPAPPPTGAQWITAYPYRRWAARRC